MATSTLARFMFRAPRDEAGQVPPSTWGQAFPAAENAPAWLWGQGTPAAIAPFTTVNKGSIYSEVNASDDNPNLWMKVDEGLAASDWVLMNNVGILIVRSPLIDISEGDVEHVIFNAVTACEILEAGILYEEATVTSDADEGDITIGTASGGGQIVAATAYAVSQASGAYQALTIASGVLAAGTSVFCSHDDAASAAGTVRVQLKIRVEA